MAPRTVGLDWAIALIAGYIATKVTDGAQRALWRATPESEKAREPETLHPSSAKSAAHLLCERCGITPTEPRLRLFKKIIHYGLGVGWGSVYGLLRRESDMSARGAGIAAGASMSLIVDEALNPMFGITPPARAYPASAHVRGLLTHLVYGFALAVAAEGMYRLVRSGGAHRRGAGRPPASSSPLVMPVRAAAPIGRSR